MFRKIKKKLQEPYFIQDIIYDFVRPAVLGAVGAAIGIVISRLIGLV